MPRKGKSRKRRVVIDTSVLVAGISGFREPFVPGRNPSADVLHQWAERNHFVWLITEDILDEYKEVRNAGNNMQRSFFSQMPLDCELANC